RAAHTVLESFPPCERGERELRRAESRRLVAVSRRRSRIIVRRRRHPNGFHDRRTADVLHVPTQPPLLTDEDEPMIHRHSVRRGWWSAAIVGALAAPLVGCNLRHELVAPQTPGVIDDAALAGPTGANGLRLGALAELKRQTAAGETLWQLGGLLSDEWKSASA